jgi:hypothetical protein
MAKIMMTAVVLKVYLCGEKLLAASSVSSMVIDPISLAQKRTDHLTRLLPGLRSEPDDGTARANRRIIHLFEKTKVVDGATRHCLPQGSKSYKRCVRSSARLVNPCCGLGGWRDRYENRLQVLGPAPSLRSLTLARSRAQPSLLTWRARPIANDSGGTSSVIAEPAAT